MQEELICIKVNNLQSALLAFKAKADAIVPLEGITFEDLRKIKALGLKILNKDSLCSLTDMQIKYLGIEDIKCNIVETNINNIESAYWCTRCKALEREGIILSDPLYQLSYEQMLVTQAKPGLLVGSVEKTLKDRIVIKFTKAVALKDILAIDDNEVEVCDIEDNKSFIAPNTTCSISFKTEKNDLKPKFSTPVYCIHRHNMRVEKMDENIALYKEKIDINVIIEENNLLINNISFPVEIQNSNKNYEILHILKSVFSSSGSSFYTLGNLEIENKSSFDKPFVALAQLKKIKKDFYNNQDALFLK